MNYRRIYFLLVIIGLLIAASHGWTWVQNRQAEAGTAEQISIPMERTAPGQIKTAVQRIDLWQSRVRQSPQDYISMTYLGQAYLERARETGDGDNYDLAEDALNQALALNSQHQPATAFLASVHFARHQFADALALAEAIYAEDPAALHALALIGDAQLELGRYEEATDSYNQLYEQNQSPPVLSRLARLSWLQGEPDAAIAQMSQAAEDAVEMGLLGESAAWYQFQLGELYFKTGQLDAAQAQYERTLTTFPDYYLARAGLAKTAAATGNLEQAITLYELVIATAPHPEIVAALGDLYSLMGDETSARQQYQVVTSIGKQLAANPAESRHFVYYYTDHDINIPEAVELAEQDLMTRSDIYAYDALAWALYKDGRFPAALSAIEQALSLGTQDAPLLYHAGMIYDAVGRSDEARYMLQQALSTNPYFDLQQAAIAQSTLNRLENNR